MDKCCNAQYLSVLNRGKDWSAFWAAHVIMTSLVLRAAVIKSAKGESSNPKPKSRIKLKILCIFTLTSLYNLFDMISLYNLFAPGPS